MENYEQKYKKALGWMRSIYPTMQGADKEDAEHYFPELRELEDERIRKEIIQSIQDNMCVIHKDKCISWLEKQGEQKNAWSEEDEDALDIVIRIIQNGGDDCSGILDSDKALKWLKSLKDKVQPQPKQEWNEEDEKTIDEAVEKLEKYAEYVQGGNSKRYILDLASRVESLKPNHWKPSEQNIKDLEWCADLVKDNLGVGFHRLQVFIDEIKNL